MIKHKKSLSVFLWIIQLIAAGILLNASISKFFALPMAVEVFTKIGLEPNGRIIIGILELICAFLLVNPYSIVYGAFLGLGIMTGAVIGHFTSIGIEGLHMAAIVFISCLTIIYFRRNESSIFKNMFDR